MGGQGYVEKLTSFLYFPLLSLSLQLVAQAGLEFNHWSRIAFNSLSSYLYLLSDQSPLHMHSQSLTVQFLKRKQNVRFSIKSAGAAPLPSNM